jgi:hypothetical protein
MKDKTLSCKAVVLLHDYSLSLEWRRRMQPPIGEDADRFFEMLLVALCEAG